jgi:tetratricopeptide (TPR) repeat protein
LRVGSNAEPSETAGSLPKVTADRTEIIKKLVAYKFDTLDSELTAYERKAESDPRFEMDTMVGFGAFISSQPLIEERVKDWQKAAPDSYAAAVARRISLSVTAENWRGSDWIKEVPATDIAHMEDSFREAVKAGNAALAINPNLATAYAWKIEAARFMGSEEEVARVSGDALKRVPASLAVREQVIYALRPQWGGSREAMQKFIDGSQQYATQNPSMNLLKAWVPMDVGDAYAGENQWDQASKAYTEALQAGGEYWRAYGRRANAYRNSGKLKEAIHDALRANQLCPQNSKVLKLLAMLTAQDDRPEASILWSSTYLRFEMPDPEIFATIQISEQQMKARGTLN